MKTIKYEQRISNVHFEDERLINYVLDTLFYSGFFKYLKREIPINISKGKDFSTISTNFTISKGRFSKDLLADLSIELVELEKLKRQADIDCKEVTSKFLQGKFLATLEIKEKIEKMLQDKKY